jgi:hypothetical protein
VYARVLRGTLLLGSADLDEVERTASQALVDAESLRAARSLPLPAVWPVWLPCSARTPRRHGSDSSGALNN